MERFNVPNWYSIEHLNYRTHLKILVVDGEVAFTGGVGVADHWSGNAQDEGHWRDTQVRMRGPIVRLLEAAFDEDLIEVAGTTTPEFDDEPYAVDQERVSLMVRSSPTGGVTTTDRRRTRESFWSAIGEVF